MKWILSTIFSVLCLLVSHAQVSYYTFSQTSGTYTPITGGSNYDNFTNWTNSNFNGTSGYFDDASSSVLESIGFNFIYNGTTYTQFAVNTNGFITLGALPVNNYSPLSSTVGLDLITPASNNVISAMGRDIIGRGSLIMTVTSGSPIITITGGDINLISVGDKVQGNGIPTAVIPTVISKTATTITISSNATGTGSNRHLRFSRSGFGIRFQTIGTAPNRTLVVQWTGWQRYTTNTAFGELYNFQIRLNETTNTINIVYDIQGPTSATPTTFQIGLRGNSNADFNNRTSTTSWSTTSAGTLNSSNLTLSSTVKPVSGQTYIWTPPAVLPVEMLYFDGYGYPVFNVLKWSTASEHNSNYFSIQRSSNGVDWKEVGQKIAAGNSTTQINYSYTDSYINDGVVYYKLIQFDYDGKSKAYGPIAIVYYKTDKKVLKYVNLLGQEVNPETKGFLFEVYEDGTMNKIIR